MKPPSQITSTANPRYRALREALLASGPKRTYTLLSGAKLIEAWHTARSGADPRSPTTPALAGGARLKPELWIGLEGVPPPAFARTLDIEAWAVSAKVLAALTEAGSPPDCALVMGVGPDSTGPLADRVIAPWGIQDPGNLGAILRSAASFGFQEALLGPGCADPFSPKALRGSMGAAFLMPLRRCETIPFDEGHWYALDGGEGALPLATADLSGPLRLLVGNEGHGWQKLALPAHVQRLAIPIQGMESLNAAVAAGIACYEAARRLA